MICMRPVNKCRRHGLEYKTPIAITAKCTDCILLMHDVNSKIATGNWHNDQVQLTKHLDIMHCLLVTSETPDLYTIGQLYPIPLMD